MYILKFIHIQYHWRSLVNSQISILKKWPLNIVVFTSAKKEEHKVGGIPLNVERDNVLEKYGHI